MDIIDRLIELNKDDDNTRIHLLQYKNLREHFYSLSNEVLGEDYYNLGMDTYTCDKMTTEDIKRKFKNTNSNLIRANIFLIISSLVNIGLVIKMI